MGRELKLFIMSYSSVTICLFYAFFIYQYLVEESKNIDPLSILLVSFGTTSVILLINCPLIYLFPKISPPIFYIFFSFMGYLVNIFNGSIILFILSKFINMNYLVKIILFYGLPLLMSVIGQIRAEIIYFDRYEIKVEQWENESIENDVKIAHLSDLHLCPIYGKKFVEKIVNILNNEEGISFVVLTGDIVDGDIFENKINYEILEPFKKLKYKIYYVSGNHEEYTDKKVLFELLEKVGIVHLNNKVEILEEYKINLIGIDYDKNYKKVKNETLPKLCQISKENNYPNVVLSHIPFFRPKHLVKYDIFLFLCGHTHGAQMFPTVIFLYLKNTVFSGLYNYLNKYYVYCASGVGNSGPPLRQIIRANIGLITLKKFLYI